MALSSDGSSEGLTIAHGASIMREDVRWKVRDRLIRIPDQRDSLGRFGLVYAWAYEAAHQDQAVVKSAAVNRVGLRRVGGRQPVAQAAGGVADGPPAVSRPPSGRPAGGLGRQRLALG